MKVFSLALMTLLAGTASLLRGATLLSDDFATLDPSKWSEVTSSGSATANVSASGGFLNLKNSSASAGHRSYLLSQQTDLDPFAQALTFTFSGLTLTGTPAGAHTTGGSVGFYAMVGLASDTAHYYAGATTAPADYLAFQLLSFTDGYQIKVLDYGGATTSQITYNLTGAPTGISWTIDGASNSYSLLLTGTTFSTGLDTQTGTFVNFNEAGLGTTPASRLAIGVLNGSLALAAGSQATLDSVSVDAVPEPPQAALLLLGGAAVLVAAARRQGGRFPLARRDLSS